jgi:Beta-1,3-glucanase
VIASPPAPETINAGQGAEFIVSAPGATAFQWYKNGVSIPGATSASFHTPALSAADATTSFVVAVGNGVGSTISSTGAITVNPNADGSPPASFWGTPASLPVATQVMTFSFVNRTNGNYPDSQLFWRITGTLSNGTQINETHSFADTPTYDMPEVGSARMYFYIAPNLAAVAENPTNYYDFIELNIFAGSGGASYAINADTTRVDAFGLKLALRLQCGDGTDETRGEDYGTFLEDRSVTFQKYLAEVPAEFSATATQNAPYRIVEPGAGGFSTGGPNAAYFSAYVDAVYAANHIDATIVPKPTPFLNFANGQITDLSAAIQRHVAQNPGTFNADGTLVNPNFWSTVPASSFYSTGPANFYAQYWHTHGIGGFAYGFPYDDVGSHSSDIGCGTPQRMIVALGW